MVRYALARLCGRPHIRRVLSFRQRLCVPKVLLPRFVNRLYCSI
jgi:hypothetical protein